jgi:hypothetical protein
MPYPNRDSQFKPGQSGNPGGRPKKVSLTALLREALAREVEGRTVGEKLVEVMVQNALKGDFRFCRDLMDRIDGKPHQSVSVTTNEAEESMDPRVAEAMLRAMFETRELIDAGGDPEDQMDERWHESRPG